MKKQLKSFKYAINGIIHNFQAHPNFRFHLVAAVISVLLGIYLGLSNLEWVVLILTIIMVVVAEMINTSLESITDLVTKEYKEEAKIAKDTAAGLVLIAALGAIIVGVLLFLPKLSSF